MYSGILTNITICKLLYIATKFYVALLHNHAIVALGLYHIVFITTEKIIICSHLLAHANTYFYMTLLCMHDTATYSTVQ